MIKNFDINMLYDMHDNRFENGDVVDIHQTVNGQSKFVVFIDEERLNVKYFNLHHGQDMFYEYNILDLLEHKEYEKSIEIIGTLPKDSWLDLLKRSFEQDFFDKVIWPEEFLDEDLIKSVKGISKYDL